MYITQTFAKTLATESAATIQKSIASMHSPPSLALGGSKVVTESGAVGNV
jgi:hypothetical protein